MAVAKRSAEWLEDLGIRTVVDIGSGAGKFCVAGALFGKCQFIGLEKYSSLVTSARALAGLFDLTDRVSFLAGALGSAATPVGDAYYFFNPFGDYWLGADYPLEASAEFTDTRYADDVAAAEDLLRRAHVGTWILTYNGFGGRVPVGYELVRVDWELRGVLRLWRKPGKPGGCSPNWYATEDEGTVVRSARSCVRICARNAIGARVRD